MFTILDMVDNQPVLTNIFDFRHDNITDDRFRLDRTFMKLEVWTRLVVTEELISIMS